MEKHNVQVTAACSIFRWPQLMHRLNLMVINKIINDFPYNDHKLIFPFNLGTLLFSKFRNLVSSNPDRCSRLSKVDDKNLEPPAVNRSQQLWMTTPCDRMSSPNQ
jgi:hypothetical protein